MRGLIASGFGDVKGPIGRTSQSAAALLGEGDRSGARRELDAALKYRPKDPEWLATLAKLEERGAAR